MIIRTYVCLNRRCLNEYTTDGDHPPCPACGGLRVQWVPKSFGINHGETARIDNTVRELAEQAGLTNFNSPQRDRPVVPRAGPTGTPTEQLRFAPKENPGWGVNLPPACLTGSGAAYCAPTGVTAKLQNNKYNMLDKAVPASKTLGAASRIEGSYRPPDGIPE